MLSAEMLSLVTAVEKSMYRSLTDLEELTQELSQAVDRGDRVSIQMFLSMRQEPLDQLLKQQAALRRQRAGLSPEDGRLLRALLEDTEPPACSGSEELVRQATRNRTLLERIIQTDRRISQRLGGSASFYAKHP